MKKFIKFILCTALLTTALSLTTFAKSGDIIGYAKYTDISAYINHYPITSYNINGNTAVVAEDLANYGFNVVWNNSARTLTVTRSGGTTITPYGTVYKYSSKVGQNSFPIYETDIVTYVNNVPVTSFAIGGKTCVYIDSLAPYGELAWVPEQRATKLWISGLPIKDYAPLQEEPTPKVTVSSTTSNNSTSIASILKKCERYVNYAYIQGDILKTTVDLYRINGKASNLTSMQKTISDINNNVLKIQELTANESRLYPLYLEAKISPVVATSSSLSSVTSYGTKAMRIKTVYNIYAKEYGIQ